jgi:hypothetical protein
VKITTHWGEDASLHTITYPADQDFAALREVLTWCEENDRSIHALYAHCDPYDESNNQFSFATGAS